MSRDIDNRKSGFGGFDSRGGGIDDGESRFGEDGSCSNRFSTSSWNLMNQTPRLITSWWIGWYMNGSMSNRINFVFDIHRSSIFGSTRNTRRETCRDM
jgi:hypothetical protein